ncbi:MAG: type II toxin-antitoxin system RelE/ParE family toxin [Gemmatimonadaceae bacterium]
MPPVLVRPLAEADVAEAADWYELQAPGLGPQFVAEVDAVFTHIAAYPASFPAVYREIRRALLRRFPYAVYYRLVDARPQVIACTHVRRHPRTWRRRDA